jgi:endonuclease G
MTNQHTFYCSNVTPQLNEFNGGIWEKLESAVRDWSASSDTLYVVTGCIADNTCETVKDHDGQAVAVPKAYYKALLRLKGNTYIGAGFYLDHTNDIADGNYKDYAMSLKDLESKTGMTFFVNLPSDKAAAIKAEDPTTNKFWGLK